MHDINVAPQAFRGMLPTEYKHTRLIQSEFTFLRKKVVEIDKEIWTLEQLSDDAS